MSDSHTARENTPRGEQGLVSVQICWMALSWLHGGVEHFSEVSGPDDGNAAFGNVTLVHANHFCWGAFQSALHYFLAS